MKVKLNLRNTKLNATAKKKRLFYLCNHPDDKEKSWLEGDTSLAGKRIRCHMWFH